MAKVSKKAAEKPVDTPVDAGKSAEVAARKAALTRKLYALAGDESKADEFEAVRVELEALA